MKKKFLTLSVIMCMALSVVACGKEKIADPEVPQAAIADLADEEIEEVTEDLDYNDETEVAEESSENYVLCGTLYSSMKYQSGEFDEYGKIQAIIYDGGLEDDTFTLVGTVYFKTQRIRTQ